METWYLCDSKVISLPSSIGRLVNLKVLDLRNTTILWKFPKEIGDLIGLEKLFLVDILAIVPLLPSSIWQLHNLKLLSINQDFSTLASHGNPSFIVTTHCVERLTGLMYFYINIHHTFWPRHLEEDIWKWLLRLVKRCPSLGSIVVRCGHDYRMQNTMHVQNLLERLSFALACNRARTRIRSHGQSLGAEEPTGGGTTE